ncbi:MAG TPA: PHP domain-containing protein [Candidatus Anoxymicrobiaceae bacterium]|jgi:predicted metal-dependent phosphoesterase TrpH
MLVDLHVHTNISSRCSSVMPEELVERSMELGLDAVCVTEHATSRGAQVNYEYAKEHGFLVFRGMEVYTEQGDMLAIGWDTNIRYYLFPFADLKREVEERNGIIIPAHPCRGIADARHRSKDEIEAELLESVCTFEVCNGAVTRKSNEMARKLSEKYGLFGTGGSDAHHIDHIGRCVTVFEEEPGNEVELIEALRGGKYRACYYEDI